MVEVVGSGTLVLVYGIFLDPGMGVSIGGFSVGLVGGGLGVLVLQVPAVSRIARCRVVASIAHARSSGW